MDKVLETTPSNMKDGFTLLTLDGQGPAWYTVNDDVMGGVSSSEVSIDIEKQRLVFSGNLSLENGGGFASTRTRWSEHDLAQYDGIILRVCGDNRDYQFRIRTEADGMRITYTTVLEIKPGTWQDIYIPFAEMTPIYRGVVVREAPALDPGAIRSFGFIVADKQAGAFRLEVEMLGAVTAGTPQVREYETSECI